LALQPWPARVACDLQINNCRTVAFRSANGGTNLIDDPYTLAAVAVTVAIGQLKKEAGL
jgi:hypothetical protein